MPQPYDAFRFVLSLNGEPVGGFSDVSGIGADIRRVRRVTELSLKRGVMDSGKFFEWLRASSHDAVRPVATITVFDASRQPIRTWAIRGALPVKHTGPTLAARGGDVEMEELVLSAEGIEPAG